MKSCSGMPFSMSSSPSTRNISSEWLHTTNGPLARTKLFEEFQPITFLSLLSKQEYHRVLPLEKEYLWHIAGGYFKTCSFHRYTTHSFIVVAIKKEYFRFVMTLRRSYAAEVGRLSPMSRSGLKMYQPPQRRIYRGEIKGLVLLLSWSRDL